MRLADAKRRYLNKERLLAVSRLRNLFVSLILCGGFALLGILTLPSVLGRVLVVISIACFLAATGLHFIWSRRLVAQFKLEQGQLREAINASRSITHVRTADQSKPVASNEEPSETQSDRLELRNSYSPNLITALPSSERTFAHQAGRLAAQLEDNANSLLKLTQLLHGDLDRSRRVSWIGSDESAQKISALAEINHIMPGQDFCLSSLDTSSIVIYERDLGSVWEGLTNAQRTNSFLDLYNELNRAKLEGILIITVAATTKDTFSDSLYQSSHFVIDNDRLITNYKTNSPSDVNLPIIQHLLSSQKDHTSTISPAKN